MSNLVISLYAFSFLKKDTIGQNPAQFYSLHTIKTQNDKKESGGGMFYVLQ